MTTALTQSRWSVYIEEDGRSEIFYTMKKYMREINTFHIQYCIDFGTLPYVMISINRNAVFLIIKKINDQFYVVYLYATCNKWNTIGNC